MVQDNPEFIAGEVKRLQDEYRDGSQSALAKLIHLFREPLEAHATRLVGRQEAPDLVQDLYMILSNKHHQYDYNQNWLPWAQQSLQHLCIDWLRKRASKAIPPEKLPVLARIAKPILKTVASRLARLDECLDNLTAADRLLISQRFEDELTFRKLADADPDLSRSAAHRRISEILMKLKLCLKNPAAE